MTMTDEPSPSSTLTLTLTQTPLALEGLGDTRVRPSDGTLMVYVPGGEFLMGSSDEQIEAQLELCSPPSEACYKEFFQGEMPQHPVRVDSFWMDQTEVTNAQFVAFLNDYGDRAENSANLLVLDRGYCKIKQDEDGEYYTSKGASDYPVVMVTWHGANEYCRWAGGRLPTEAEWEYAARGPENNLYPWGNDLPTRELAHYAASVETRVGSYPQGASWCGVYDMAGNVWEWTADWYGSYSALPQENPTGPASGGIKAIHGGGWHSSQRELRSAYRLHDTASTGYNG
jgi:formylglycine-generating enzyme required for sulfatase activity